MERTASAFRLDCAVTDRLRNLVTLIERWTRTVNLIAASDVAQIWERHVEDCVQLAAFIPRGLPHAIDLGSGAGFPGLVLAIVTQTPYLLIESDHRKAAFLREAIRQTGAPATVFAVRAEQASVPPAPLVTARALASLGQLLDWAAPLLTGDGICLFPKGRSADQEMVSAARSWHMNVERWPSRTESAATIFRISDLIRVRPRGST